MNVTSATIFLLFSVSLSRPGLAATAGTNAKSDTTPSESCTLPSVTGSLVGTSELVVTLRSSRPGSLQLFVSSATHTLVPGPSKRFLPADIAVAGIAPSTPIFIPLSTDVPLPVIIDTSPLRAPTESAANFRLYYQWTDNTCAMSPAGSTLASHPEMDFRFDAGAVFLFNGDSTVSTRAETAVGFLLQPTLRHTVDVDIRYSGLPAVTASTNATTMPSKFDNASGSLDASIGYLYSLGVTSLFAPRVGVGFRTLVGNSAVHGFAQAAPRVSIGMRAWFPPKENSPLDSMYNRHSGFIEVGYSKDRFWTDVPEVGKAFTLENRPDRVYAILEYTLVGGQGAGSALLLRGFVNTPLQLHGATEVKLSVLVAVDPGAVLAALLPKGK